MKKSILFKTLLFIVAILVISCTDQPVKKANKTKIENREAQSKPISLLDKGFHKAIFSPTADKIIASSENDKGLSVYDFKNDVVEHLNSKDGAGINPMFTKDGKYVIFQSQEFKNRRRMTGIFMQDVVEKVILPIVEDKRNIKLLNVVNNKVYYLEDENVKAFDIIHGETSVNPKDALIAFTDNNLNLSILANGKKINLNPQGEGNYIWVSLSPDGRKILYNKSGKGTYISDLKGKTIVDLGRLHAAKWSKDGKWILGMDDYDDGHKYTKSDILMVSSDGVTKKNLTQNSDAIALYPDISYDNKDVIYHNDDGRVFIMKLK